MRLIAKAGERATQTAAELEAAKAEILQLTEREAQAGAKVGELQAVIEKLEERERAILEQLDARQQDADDLREQLSGARARLDAVSNELSSAQRQALMNAEMLARTEDLLTQAKQMHETAHERSKAAEQELLLQLNRTADQVREAENRLRQHFDETARLSELLLDRDMRLQGQGDRLDRLKKIERALSSAPGWWGLLPVARRRRLQAERLKRRNLFDAAGYLRFNPDVAAEGFDPVEHYLLHGLDEDRRF
jgi:chromosome segregation ATPase